MHRSSRRRPRGQLQRIDVTDACQLIEMFLIVPVAKSRDVPVCPTLASILRSRLAVHLENSTTRLAQETAQQMYIVDLHRCGSGLMRLIDALQYCRHERRTLAKNVGCLAQARCRNAGHLLRTFRRPLLDDLLHLLEAYRMACDP